MPNTLLEDLKRRMTATQDSVHKDFATLRTGRAAPSMLEAIVVDAYGSKMPLTQVGNISAPEPRTLSVQVWDASLVNHVEKAIREAGLGLNPSSAGQVIRVPVPELSEERRKEFVKVAGKYAEDGRVAVRGVRRDGMDKIKKMEKDGEISEDDMHRLSDDIQKATDDFIKKIDDALAHKEKEIMQV